MPADANWNSLVSPENCLQSPNSNNRRPTKLVPTHIVIHDTGTDSLESVQNTFLTQYSVSAHYLVTNDGDLFQFVPDAYRAWHAGVDPNSRNLYRKGADTWKQYLRYFSWYKGYPNDALYVDGDLKPVWDETEAMFVARADEQMWAQYDYFKSRWGYQDFPVNFTVDPDPNNYTIGIEILSFGALAADENIYTPEMYGTLQRLVKDLSDKYSIPMEKERVVGHEDVNPIARFGWDPAAGFDWSQVHS